MEQRVATRMLDRMAEGVSEVERLAESGFARVGTHHAGLDRHAGRDGGKQRGRLASEQIRDRALEIREVLGACHHAMLDRFGESRAPVRGRERADQLDVDQHCGGRMKSADEILARRRIHPRLAADRRVDHGEQRGGTLDHGHAAQEGRGHEAGEVADDTATESDDGSVAAIARREQLVRDACPALAALVRLAGGDDVQRGARLLVEVANEGSGVELRDVAVRDDGIRMGRRGARDRGAELRSQAAPDGDAIVSGVDHRVLLTSGAVVRVAKRYQGTSAEPARRLATRARVKSRSDRRLR